MSNDLNTRNSCGGDKGRTPILNGTPSMTPMESVGVGVGGSGSHGNSRSVVLEHRTDPVPLRGRT